jgi:hypothetical protein
VIALWTMAVAGASTGWSQPRPYAFPVLNIGVVSVPGGTPVAQASVGLVGGARVKYREAPGWLWDTRGSLIGTYGLNTSSLGADARVGTFIGPDVKLITYQVGPEVWIDGYGRPDSIDYYLPWSPGVDLFNEVTLKLIPQVHVVGQVAPGFAFDGRRHGEGQVAPFDELMLAAMLDIRTNILSLTVGYSRQYQSYGTLDGIILSGGF